MTRREVGSSLNSLKFSVCLMSLQNPVLCVDSTASCCPYRGRGRICQAYRTSPSGVDKEKGVTWFSRVCATVFSRQPFVRLLITCLDARFYVMQPNARVHKRQKLTGEAPFCWLIDLVPPQRVNLVRIQKTRRKTQSA